MGPPLFRTASLTHGMVEATANRRGRNDGRPLIYRGEVPRVLQPPKYASYFMSRSPWYYAPENSLLRQGSGQKNRRNLL